MTEWRPVKDYEGLYEVSDTGLVKSLEKRVDRGKCHRSWSTHIRAFGKDANGYLRVSLSKDGVNKTHKVHRLVAQAFIPNPDNLPQVNHIDGDKTNNNVDNLEWCTQSENMRHAYKLRLKSIAGECNPQSKLTQADVNHIRAIYKPRDKEFGAIALGKKYGVHRKTISRITTGQYWR